jgi:hypothetical protein
MLPATQRHEFVADVCWRRTSKGWQFSQLSRQSVRVTRHVIISVQQHMMPVCCWSLLRLVQWVVHQTVVNYHSWLTGGNWTIVTDRSAMCIALTLAIYVWINERMRLLCQIQHMLFLVKTPVALLSAVYNSANLRPLIKNALTLIKVNTI